MGYKPKQLFILPISLLIILSILIGNRLGKSEEKIIIDSLKTWQYHNDDVGIEFELPGTYKLSKYQTKNEESDRSSNKVIANFWRSYPEAFLTARYETGLQLITNLAHRSLIEHFETEITQFFPIRYGEGYQSLSLKRIQIANRDAVEHIFFYNIKQQDQTLRFKTKIILIAWHPNTAYYLIFQGSIDDFETVQNDFDDILSSLVLNGPKTTPQQEE